MRFKKTQFFVGLATIILSLLFFLGAGTRTVQGSADDPCSGGTLAYWPMDEGTGNLIQDICNGYNGSWTQGVSWSTDEEGSYLQFSGGSGERIAINTTALSQNTSITVELRMMPGSDRSSPLRVISQMKPSDGSGGHLRFTLDYSGSRLEVWGGTGGGRFWYCGDGKINCLPANEWVHVAFQINGTQVWIYYDGVLVASGSLPYPQILRATNAITEIGCGERIYNFDGKIQYIRISQGIRNDFILTRPPQNQTPIAHAGVDQTVFTNQLVTLDGSGSSDPDSDPLTYAWSEGGTNPQTGILSDTTSVNPSFTPIVAGTYTLNLVVNDGKVDSATDTVIITVQTPPTIGANLAGYVPPTGSECDIDVPLQYSTIQAGIDAASSGDTVCVGAGLYNEDIKIYAKSIRLSGRGASASVIIGKTTTPDQGGTVYVGAASNVIVEGFLIRGVGSDRQTGAVRIWEQVSDSLVRYNWIIAGNGENAFLTDNGQTNFLIQNNIIEGNNSPMVAHVNAFDANKPSHKVDFLNNTFIGTVNPISGWDSGWVLQASAPNSLLNQNSFQTTGTINALIVANPANSVNENNLNGGNHIKVRNSGAPYPYSLNAENNWWGDSDPSDNIYGDVDFTPFVQIPFLEYPIPDWNHPPIVDTGGPYTVYEGSMVTLSGSGLDPNGDPLNLAWDLDNDGSFETSGSNPEFSAVNRDGPDIQVVVLRVCDDRGGCVAVNTSVEIINYVPVISATINDSPKTEGSAVSIEVIASDAAGDLDPLEFEFDCDNDGIFETGPQFENSTTCLFADNGDFQVSVKVSDGDGGEDIDSTMAQIINASPVVELIYAPLDPVPIGVPIEVIGEFSDPGQQDSHTATWDWGNNEVTDGIVDGYVSSGSYTYSSSGVYTITLSVTDDDGGMDISYYSYVVIYDPAGGFVTGSGWINSPAGAVIGKPHLTGKAIFGFVSKYKNGATTPSGKTQFHFQVAGLKFNSTSYQWLVVSGKKAQLKGFGTVNGDGEYGFMISAIDGDLQGGNGIDLFRIKIWDIASGDVIYDNQFGAEDDEDPTTQVQAGSIAIHKE
jgi:PKD repeat protein